MTFLTREQILATEGNLKREEVDVPEWGGKVLMQELMAADRDAWEQSLVVTGRDGKAQTNTVNLRARLFSWTCVDETGKRLFSEKDTDKLGKLSGAALERCVKVSQRLNGLGEDEMEKLKGNSDSAPSDASTSNSPSTSGAPSDGS